MADFPEYVTANDLLVVNDTKVFPARLLGTWSDSPGAVEILMVSPATDADSLEARGDRAGEVLSWRVMIGSGRPARAGQVAVFGPNRELRVELVKKVGGGMWTCAFVSARPLNALLDAFGRTPVPPYVHREGTREEEMADRARYQTIYAKHLGSVAAPTAGLHFTPELIQKIRDHGCGWATVELEVGIDTFRLVTEDDPTQHVMHTERYHVSQEVVDAVHKAKAEGHRVIAVGTTAVRSLESAFDADAPVSDPAVTARYFEGREDGADTLGRGDIVVRENATTQLYLMPGSTYHVVDALITNFHVPRSTLMMLVSALATRDQIMDAYAAAIEERYRFFSFGDAMLIL